MLLEGSGELSDLRGGDQGQQGMCFLLGVLGTQACCITRRSPRAAPLISFSWRLSTQEQEKKVVMVLPRDQWSLALFFRPLILKKIIIVDSLELTNIIQKVPILTSAPVGTSYMTIL